MKKAITSISIMLFLLGGAMAQSANASDYKFIKKTGATSLYERWIEGIKGDEVRELKAVFVVQATPEAIEELLKNETQGTRWNTRASHYKIAATAQANQWVNYIRYDMPTLMDDQDCCLVFTKQTLANKATVFHFQSTNAAVFPIEKGVKRVSGVKGKWLLQPLTGGQTRITYTITSDKSGNIPRLISDPIIRDNLFSTMAKFKSIVEQ